ncbi:hypothetical protein HK097_007371 [Rhizophlyctis rosea]|uniref:Uncharacterized protein n=1 Tax=Rhizophlyctis rosea TaxID=64517 RepID=A0AAD5SDM7_9FUNG|nr:hypothetical protein HK097_007371 [Rhizophlyctis rosea]
MWVTPRAADGSVVTGANAVCTAQGISRCFNRIEVRSGSTPIETFQYDDVVGLFYSTQSDKKKKWLKLTEGHNDTAAFTNGTREFGGVQLIFSLANVDNVFLNPAVASFTIENPALRTCLIYPDPSVVHALTSAVASGRSAWLPTSEIESFRTVGLNSTNILVTNSVGSYTSIDSVRYACYKQPEYNARSNDKYKRFSSNGLREWSVEVANLTNPATRKFRNGNGSIETIMITFLSEAGGLNNMDDICNLPDDFYTPHFQWGLNFQSQSEQHASGISTVGAANTNIVGDFTFAAPITSDVVINTYVTCSTLLEVTQGLINTWRVF